MSGVDFKMLIKADLMKLEGHRAVDTLGAASTLVAEVEEVHITTLEWNQTKSVSYELIMESRGVL